MRFFKLVVFILFVSFELYATSVNQKIQSEIKKSFEKDFKLWQATFSESEIAISFVKPDLVFTRGESQISDLYKMVLDDFFPRYLAILLKYEKYIEEVIIEGHTSSENRQGRNEEEKFLRNMILSQERADSFYLYISFMKNKIIQDNKNFIKKRIKAVAKSSSEPVLDEQGVEDRKSSRRIKVVLKLKESAFKVENTKVDNLISALTEDELVEQFEDVIEKKHLTLEHYVRRLLLESGTINEQYRYLEALQRDIEMAKGAFLPTLDYQYTLKKYFDSSDDYAKSSGHDLTFKYNIFNGFRDELEEKINQENYITNIFSKDQIVEETVYSLAEAYITAIKVLEFYNLSRENYSAYMQWVEKEKIRFQNGLTSLKDFSKIEARAINRYMNFEEDTKRFNDTISTMQKYLDFDDNNIKLLKIHDPYVSYYDNIREALKASEKFSPYIKEAKQNVNLYKTKLEKSKVTFYPSVDLVAKKIQTDYTYVSDIESDTFEESVAIEAKFQLYNGGKDQSDHEKKSYEYRQKIEKLRSVIRDVKYELDLRFNKYYMLSSKNDFVDELVTKRETEYIAANYDYKFAKIDANGLLDVVDSVYNAKRLAIETKYDLILVKYEILKEMGIIKKYIMNEL